MINNLSLAVMAAGLGSRYGGPKQMAPVDDDGCFIIDYSVYDALCAGIDNIVFIIKKEMEQDFRDTIGKRIERRANVSYVFQDMNDLPPGFKPPVGRVKPWGTGHAVLAARFAVTGPFITVNADDFYGRESYAAIAESLRGLSPGECVMSAYELGNTLTGEGGVSRGICAADGSGRLTKVEEHYEIKRQDNRAVCAAHDGTRAEYALDTLVSMNMWGFHQSILRELSQGFEDFLSGLPREKELTAEFLLPDFIQRLIGEGRTAVNVRKTDSRWFGLTYKNDRETLVEAIEQYKKRGIYPERLWGAE